MVQLLIPYTDHERQNTFRHRQRQMDGRTDDSIMPIANHILRAAVRSVKAKIHYTSFPVASPQQVANKYTGNRPVYGEATGKRV